MRLKILLSLLLFAAAPASAADQALCRELGLRSAGVFFDSIAYELRKSPESAAALAALPPGEPGASLAAAAGTDTATQSGLFDAAAALIPMDVLEAAARGKAAAAIAEARVYISPSTARTCEERPAPAPAPAPPDAVFREGATPETAAADPGLVEWKDAGAAATILIILILL